MASASKKKNRGRGVGSKKQPESSDEAAVSQPPPSPRLAAPNGDATLGSPPTSDVEYLSEEEKDMFWRVILSAGGEDGGASDDSVEYLKVAPVKLEEIDGRALLGRYLALLSDSVPKTMSYIKSTKNFLETKKKEVFTDVLSLNLFTASLGDLQANFDSYEKMTKLLLKKAKHDRDRLKEWEGSSTSAAAGEACGGEPSVA